MSKKFILITMLLAQVSLFALEDKAQLLTDVYKQKKNLFNNLATSPASAVIRKNNLYFIDLSDDKNCLGQSVSRVNLETKKVEKTWNDFACIVQIFNSPEGIRLTNKKSDTLTSWILSDNSEDWKAYKSSTDSDSSKVLPLLNARLKREIRLQGWESIEDSEIRWKLISNTGSKNVKWSCYYSQNDNHYLILDEFEGANPTQMRPQTRLLPKINSDSGSSLYLTDKAIYYWEAKPNSKAKKLTTFNFEKPLESHVLFETSTEVKSMQYEKGMIFIIAEPESTLLYQYSEADQKLLIVRIPFSDMSGITWSNDGFIISRATAGEISWYGKESNQKESK